MHPHLRLCNHLVMLKGIKKAIYSFTLLRAHPIDYWFSPYVSLSACLVCMLPHSTAEPFGKNRRIIFSFKHLYVEGDCEVYLLAD